jgi:hypothetical protein
VENRNSPALSRLKDKGSVTDSGQLNGAEITQFAAPSSTFRVSFIIVKGGTESSPCFHVRVLKHFPLFHALWCSMVCWPDVPVFGAVAL